MNTTVNFELAKLLKEKGYDQDGFNIAWYNELGRLNGRTDINKEDIQLLEAKINLKVRAEFGFVYDVH